MRIIGGRLKGIRINPPSNLPVRPTTDMAREALFNILTNQYDLENLHVLDLFSGTGGISLEFASRGAAEVISVDKNYGCYQFLDKLAKQYKLENLRPRKADAFNFIKRNTGPYDLIFADPPFNHPQLPLLPGLILESGLTKPDGLFILEHPSMIKMDHYPNLSETRKYGYPSFSFFTG